MSLPLPYKQINKLVEEQTFESTFTWGMRMAISATMPLIWGAITGRIPEAIWMSLAAEGICFVELRGSFGQGLRVLIAGVFLTYIFSLFGSITGINIWLSVIGMLIVGFLSGLFKNLGDRGSALSVSVFVVYIICNAFPTHTLHELNERMWLILAGGVWTAFVGIVILAFIPAQEPYRRTIGLIWKAVADLSATISYGWDGKTIRSSTRDIYQKEKAVRTAIDTSLHFYSTLAHQTQANTREHHMAHVRKATAVLSTHINAISEELETISIKDINKTLQLRIHDVLKGLQQTADRMAVFIITLKPEDELLIGASIKRLQQFVSILKEHAPANEDKYAYQVKRVVQLSERCIKLIESCVKRLEDMETDKPVFQSYSLLKTIIILHPRHWLKNIVILFNFNTFTTRYAIRTALAATVAIFISKWFNIDHGYWIPFTVIIVSQPYFGATFKKAIDRILGTVLGGVAGGILLRLHTGLWVEITIIFLSAIMMIYFMRKQYSFAAFFITVSLILLFNIEVPVSQSLILSRAFSTICGSIIAIIAGFALLPHRDNKSLPLYLSKAICYNYEYFNHTFFSENISTLWTRHKGIAESNNSNVFDSFTRYMHEPGSSKKQYAIYYQIITHNIRITRELNNINIERESNTEQALEKTNIHDKRLEFCQYWFQQNMTLVKQLNSSIEAGNIPGKETTVPSWITPQQIIYIDRMLVELKAMHRDLEKMKQREYEAQT